MNTCKFCRKEKNNSDSNLFCTQQCQKQYKKYEETINKLHQDFINKNFLDGQSLKQAGWKSHTRQIDKIWAEIIQ